MRTFLALFLITVFPILGRAQDVIIKRDGTKIESKVVEITSTLIKYKNFTQQEGPLRSIPISSVAEIVYDNGAFETFESNSNVTTPQENNTTNTKEGDFSGRDLLFKNGFFMDVLLGHGFYRRLYYSDYIPIDPNSYQTEHHLAVSFRIGNNWYFGKGEKWRPGVQVKWVRLGMYVKPNYPESLFIGPRTLSVCNVGFTNIIKLSENTGLEVSVVAGPNLEVDLDYGDVLMGVMVNPEVKFRYKQLALGIDYSRIFEVVSFYSQNRTDWNIFSLSAGLRF